MEADRWEKTVQFKNLGVVVASFVTWTKLLSIEPGYTGMDDRLWVELSKV